MTAGGREFQVAGAAQLKDRFKKPLKTFFQKAWVFLALVCTRVFETCCVFTGERPYTCDDCGRHFPRLDQMRDHKRSHTGERPYKCTICSKTFGLNASMRRHMLIHTGERRYFASISVIHNGHSPSIVWTLLLGVI